MSLKDKKCIPCRGGVPALEGKEIEPLLKEVDGWQLVDDKKIQKSFKTKDFVHSMDIANKITELAESEGHHPDLHVAYGSLGIEIWTHKVGGLTESDFILAAKIDDLI